MSKHTRGIIDWTANRETCGNCTFFMQHFIHTVGKFRPMYLGHCVFPNCKDRFETETCKNFTPRAEYEKFMAEVIAERAAR